jgi:hypothetical protein
MKEEKGEEQEKKIKRKHDNILIVQNPCQFSSFDNL